MLIARAMKTLCGRYLSVMAMLMKGCQVFEGIIIRNVSFHRELSLQKGFLVKSTLSSGEFSFINLFFSSCLNVYSCLAHWQSWAALAQIHSLISICATEWRWRMFAFSFCSLFSYHEWRRIQHRKVIHELKLSYQQKLWNCYYQFVSILARRRSHLNKTTFV